MEYELIEIHFATSVIWHNIPIKLVRQIVCKSSFAFAVWIRDKYFFIYY